MPILWLGRGEEKQIRFEHILVNSNTKLYNFSCKQYQFLIREHFLSSLYFSLEEKIMSKTNCIVKRIVVLHCLKLAPLGLNSCEDSMCYESVWQVCSEIMDISSHCKETSKNMGTVSYFYKFFCFCVCVLSLVDNSFLFSSMRSVAHL